MTKLDLVGGTHGDGIAGLGHKCICNLILSPPPLLWCLYAPKLVSPATHKFFEPYSHLSKKFPLAGNWQRGFLLLSAKNLNYYSTF